MSHFCKVGVMRCMDFRQNKEFNKWAQKSGLFSEDWEVFDLISSAGAAGRIFRQLKKNDEDALFEIKVFTEIHKGERLIMLHHSDCGAYNAWYGFSSSEKEKEKQLQDMKEMERIIKEKYPLLEVVKVWAELKDPKGREIEFSIID